MNEGEIDYNNCHMVRWVRAIFWCLQAPTIRGRRAGGGSERRKRRSATFRGYREDDEARRATSDDDHFHYNEVQSDPVNWRLWPSRPPKHSETATGHGGVWCVVASKFVIFAYSRRVNLMGRPAMACNDQHQRLPCQEEGLPSRAFLGVTARQTRPVPKSATETATGDCGVTGL